MAYAPSDPRSRPREPMPASARPATNKYASDDPLPEDSAAEHPRIIEEHHVVGPHGEDQIEATDEQGRRWYHVRPDPRYRADVFGFNWTWWIVIWVVFILLMWGGMWGGHGWGY